MSLLVRCTRLLLLVGDGGVSDCRGREREGEKEGGERGAEHVSAEGAGRQADRQTVADKVPNAQGGVSPIEFARLSSA